MYKTVNPAEPVDYSSTRTPSSYTCSTCQRTGVKLWRSQQLTLDCLTLLCADDAARQEGVDISSMGGNGRYVSDIGMTDKIGVLLPAIPTAANDVFWGYTSAPANGCEWWSRLPLR